MIACLLVPLCCAHPAIARVVTEERYCHVDQLPDALRQTVIVVDGRLIKPEPEGPLADNRQWRRFVMQFLDTSDPLIRQRVDARERITVVVANADGSGVTPFFVGCVPRFRAEEEKRLDAETTSFQRFFGSDWRSRMEDAGADFVTEATLALVENVKLLPAAVDGETAPFANGTLVAALSKSQLVSLESGLPRIVLYTDLDEYGFPDGTPQQVRRQAREDGDRVGLNLSYAETHMFGVGHGEAEHIKQYLSAFLLSSRAYLATLTSRDGAMSQTPTPRSVAYYQGTVDFPGTVHPMRLRLPLDQNGTLVNAWIEMQASLPKYVPVFGVMTCRQESKCQYVGDNTFAQIWDDNPDPRPDLQPWEPFGGMRSLEFELDGPRITGRIKDELGYISGKEDGLDFALDRIDGALF